MLSGWSYRKQITIDYTKVDSDLTDFPVLVKLTSSNFDFTHANSDGSDIRFCSTDEATLYDYEIERYDSSGQVAELWVRIPSVSSTADTSFYIEYGNDSASSGENATGVWDSNFSAVWHLYDTNDSTSNANNGTAYEAVQTDAKIGKGYSFDGSNDYIDAPDFGSNTTGFTVEAVIKLDTLPGDSIYDVIDKGETDSGTSDSGWVFRIRYDSVGFSFWTTDGSWVNLYGDSDSLSANTWYYIVGRYNGSESEVWANMTSLGTLSSTKTLQRGTYDHNIGRRWADDRYFDGIIDEVRISYGAARSDAWLKATYNSNFDTLLTYGSEESGSAGVTATPTAVSSSITILTPTITAIQNVTALASIVASSITIPMATASGGATIQATAIEQTITLGSPTIVTQGNITILATPVTASINQLSPTIKTDWVQQVNPVSVQVVGNTPTIIEGQGVVVSVNPIEISAFAITPNTLYDYVVTPSSIGLSLTVVSPKIVSPCLTKQPRSDLIFTKQSRSDLTFTKQSRPPVC